MKWSDEEHNYLIELIQKHGKKWKLISKLMSEKFSKTFRTEQCRARYRMNPTAIKPVEYKQTTEILPDGSHKSDKLLWLNSAKEKDPNYLLEQHGFDPNEWELVNSKNNIWNTYSKQDGIMTLYSSKITVKPRINDFNFEKLLASIQKVKPFKSKIKQFKSDSNRLLELPFFDQHFGISDYEYYQPTQAKVLSKINSNDWDEILFVVGQDMIHNNNHKGQTANGTNIEVVDMDMAWHDAESFYFPLIDAALLKANKVLIKYSKGNHDETISWAFVKLLKRLYPEVEVDDSFQERKIHSFGKVFIGITHGDKGRKNLHNVFPVEFPNEWANAKIRELHTGHFHIEDGKDVFGMMVRTLATRNKTDQWHKDNGYVGGHKRFMLFEYSTEELEAIYYV